MDRLSSLRAEANEVAERIDSLTALESDNQADIDARNMELEGLTGFGLTHQRSGDAHVLLTFGQSLDLPQGLNDP